MNRIFEVVSRMLTWKVPKSSVEISMFAAKSMPRVPLNNVHDGHAGAKNDKNVLVNKIEIVAARLVEEALVSNGN
jgi:hypothetical protein